MDFERELIPLAKLRLNKENDRHAPMASEYGCIEWLLTHHKRHMINLAKDIAEHGLSPLDAILVLPAGDEAPGAFDVWEGNRRVAALKLLDDPNRCHDGRLRQRFSTIRSKAKTPISDTVECAVAPNLEEAERLIELRHQGPQEGVGTLQWNARQKDRHQQRLGKAGRYSYSSQVLEAVKDKIDPELQGQIESSRFSISTLDRVLRSSTARDFLGLSTEAGEPRRLIEEQEALRGLTKVLRDVANGMKVSEVYDSGAIRKYFDKFKKSETPNTKKTLPDPVPLSVPGEGGGVAKKVKRSKPLDRDRKKLIPSGVTYSIKHSRINEMYRELKRLDVGSNRNAVAVLFRVFLELSVEWYLDEHGVRFKPEDKLRQKAQRAADHMEQQGWLKRNGRKGVDTMISSKDDPHAIDTFHAYVHNGSFHVVPSDLNVAFNNLRSFFDALFETTP